MQRRVESWSSPKEERDPPHNIEIEQALLGALLVDNIWIGEIAGVLGENHFFEPLHGRLFELITKLVEEGKPANAATLTHYVANDEPVGEITVKEYLYRIEACGAAHANVKPYAQLIRELADRRKIIVSAERLLAEAYETETPIVDTASRAADTLTNVIVRGEGRRTTEMIGVTAKRVIERAFDPAPADDVVPTGLKDLDRLLGGGFRNGEAICVAGRPSMGKTALCQQIAMNITSMDLSDGVVFFSFEMKKDIMVARALSSMLYNKVNPVPYSDILAKRLTPGIRYRFDDAAETLDSMNLLIDDDPNLTAAQVCARTRVIMSRWKRKGIKLRTVFIDHLGLVRPDSNYKGQRRHEIGEAFKVFKALAKELDIPAVILHQINRENTKRDNQRPDMQDLAEAGTVEQDSDVILFPHREAYQYEKPCTDADEEAERRETYAALQHDMEAIAGKNKNGPRGKVDLWCDMGSNAIRNKVR